LVVVAIIVGLVLVVVALALLAKYNIFKVPQLVGIDKLEVNDENFVLNNPNVTLDLPKEFDFKILASWYRGGGSVRLLAAFMPQSQQAVVKDPLPATELIPQNSGTRSESDEYSSYNEWAGKARKLFIELIGIREPEKLFGECFEGHVLWFRLADVIHGGRYGRTEEWYVTASSWDSSGKGVLILEIRNPEKYARFYNREMETYPIGGFGDILPRRIGEPETTVNDDSAFRAITGLGVPTADLQAPFETETVTTEPPEPSEEPAGYEDPFAPTPAEENLECEPETDCNGTEPLTNETDSFDAEQTEMLPSLEEMFLMEKNLEN